MTGHEQLVVDVWFDEFPTATWDHVHGEVSLPCFATAGRRTGPTLIRMSWHEAVRLRQALTVAIPQDRWQDPDLVTPQVAA
jgi:hypothetical protein